MRLGRAFWMRWHWRAGLLAALFLVLIALTGIVLNHARGLGLHHIYLEHPAILAAYNMQIPEGYIQDIQPLTTGTLVITSDGPVELSVQEAKNVELSISRQYRGDGISLEKFLLDLHTGHIVGLPGTILSDLTALAILFLSITGIYNWWNRTNQKKKKK